MKGFVGGEVEVDREMEKSGSSIVGQRMNELFLYDFSGFSL